MVPLTPQHTDSYPCTSPPLGGHEGTWGTRLNLICRGSFAFGVGWETWSRSRAAAVGDMAGRWKTRGSNQPKINRIPIANQWKTRTNPDLVSGGGLGSIFIVNVKKSVAWKLRTIILLHFGLVTFRIHSGRIRKVIIFMFFRLGERVHDSQHQYHLSLEAPNDFKYLKKTRTIFETYDVWKSTFWKLNRLFFGKDGPNNAGDPSSNFLNTLNMESISSRKHGMEFWYYGIGIFQQNMKYIFEIVKLSNFKTIGSYLLISIKGTSTLQLTLIFN